jgi:dihydrodipicolinate synthase/N-acetylneuraminate lyase
MEGTQYEVRTFTGIHRRHGHPFHEDGSVNFEVLTELLERQIAEGTDAVLTLGTTGEYSTNDP